MKLWKLMLALTAGALFLLASERFDKVVRGDFFAGFAGDAAALDRGMKKCEEQLSLEPKNAEAMVWHGSGLLFLAGQSLQKGDYAVGGPMWERGMKEMDTAAELNPEDLGVLIPRGATLLAASRFVPGEQGRPLLKKGLADYEKVYEIQRPYFDTLSGHQRGELLFGLAEGYHRLGDKEQARLNFERLVAVGKASGHEAEAKSWLDTGTVTVRNLGCTGCHTGSSK